MNTTRQNLRRRQHARPAGFTLVELLLVIVIIGILAGMMAVGLAGRGKEARVAAAKSDISGSLSVALDLFEQHVGRYPTPDEGLRALVEGGDIEGWQGPYLKTELKPDPWGRPYVYGTDTRYPDRYTLASSGPDGQPNTEDDIR